jgi:hypothetical protein
VTGSLIKLLSQETSKCPMFKTPSKNSGRNEMNNTDQQDRNDPHKVMKLAEEEWDQTDTWLAKYDQNGE